MAASNDQTSNEVPQSGSLDKAMESVVRVTLAGLGGSVIGLAQEKRLESMRVVTGAAATAAARRKRSPSAQLVNLPLTWAVSCVAFVAIIETSRLTSPATGILRLVEENYPDWQTPNLDPRITKSATTIMDYTLGGTVAGLAGSFGRQSHLRQRLPTAMLRGSHRLFGLVPGITLGFAAGVLQAGTDLGVAYLEEEQKQQSRQEGEEQQEQQE